MKNLYRNSFLKLMLCLFVSIALNAQISYASSKTAVSGNWGSNSSWVPAGIPNSGDDVTIPNGVTINMNIDIAVKKLTISSGGSLVFTPGKTLTINDDFEVSGSVNMAGGNINIANGKKFKLNGTSTFIWDPGNNSATGASLFNQGSEEFNSSSTLIIKKWYDYSVPLTSNISSSFGNLVLNSIVGSTIYEWDMNNGFKNSEVKGTLTVDQGWVTLDKSGTIGTNKFGGITLVGLNSTLYAHSGNRNGSMKLEVVNINNSGTFYGLYNGTGNFELVAENFTNNGNVKLAFNDGVWAVGNNIVKFEVKNNFTQGFGDFRGIYNMSNMNSGKFEFSFKNLNLNGGVFMGSYGINTTAQACKINVSGEFNINYINPSDKFRGIGLSVISGFVNASTFELKTSNSIIVRGNPMAEIITSSSNGLETIDINKNLEVHGCVVSFNYGAAVAAHLVNMEIGGKIIINGGVLNLSRLTGALNINLADIDLHSGSLNMKNDDGLTTVTMSGNYLQTGGNLNLKSNQLVASTQPITLNVTGDFTFTSGNINYDDNSNGVKHIINLRAPFIDLSGGNINGPAQSFGILNYSLNGLMKIKRGASSTVSNVKQNIKSGCTLELTAGNLQISGLATSSGDNLVIESNAVLNLANRQVIANGAGMNATVRVNAGGKLRTTNSLGLYNGTMSATLSSNGNLDYWLDSLSTIEYYAMMNQKVSGLTGNLNQNHHKYGILEVNLGTTFGTMNVSPTDNNVFVRTRLNLRSGEYRLGGFTTTIENGAGDGIVYTDGFMTSETNTSFNPSILLWKNMTLGNHIIPFGKSKSLMIPVTFQVISGAGKDMSISTRSTTPDNQPNSALSTTTATTPILNNGIDVSLTEVIDRFWVINAPGITADITFYYFGIENTLLSAFRSDKISAFVNSNNSWAIQSGFRNGSTSTTGYVLARNINTWGSFILGYTSAPLPIELIRFTAQHNNGKVDLNWSTATELNNDFFTIEKSKDGREFTHVAKLKGAGNSNQVKNYASVDMNPWEGTTYYRLKQTDFDGKFEYSELVTVKIASSTLTQLDVKTVAPNPFREKIDIRYSVVEEGEVKFQLFSLRGQLMAVDKQMSGKGMNEFTLENLESLSPGTYVLNIVYNGINVSHKLIKN